MFVDGPKAKIDLAIFDSVLFLFAKILCTCDEYIQKNIGLKFGATVSFVEHCRNQTLLNETEMYLNLYLFNQSNTRGVMQNYISYDLFFLMTLYRLPTNVLSI